MPENKNAVDINHLSKNLSDALDVSTTFVNMMQEELVANAVFRGKIEENIANIENKLNRLSQVVIEGNGHSLVGKVDRLDQRLGFVEDELQASKDADKESDNKAKERVWNFFIQNAFPILTWIGMLVFSGYQFFSKK